MVAGLALGARTAARDAVLDDIVRHVDEDGALDGRAHLGEDLGLRKVAREAVQQHRHVARRLRDDILDHRGDEGVGHELARLHERLGLPAGLRPLRHGAAQQVAARHVFEIRVLGRQLARDRTLPRTRGAQKNDDIHSGE